MGSSLVSHTTENEDDAFSKSYGATWAFQNLGECMHVLLLRSNAMKKISINGQPVI